MSKLPLQFYHCPHPHNTKKHKPCSPLASIIIAHYLDDSATETTPRPRASRSAPKGIMEIKHERNRTTRLFYQARSLGT